jgi:hypothetical protein
MIVFSLFQKMIILFDFLSRSWKEKGEVRNYNLEEEVVSRKVVGKGNWISLFAEHPLLFLQLFELRSHICEHGGVLCDAHPLGECLACVRARHRPTLCVLRAA